MVIHQGECPSQRTWKSGASNVTNLSVCHSFTVLHPRWAPSSNHIRGRTFAVKSNNFTRNGCPIPGAYFCHRHIVHIPSLSASLSLSASTCRPNPDDEYRNEKWSGTSCWIPWKLMLNLGARFILILLFVNHQQLMGGWLNSGVFILLEKQRMIAGGICWGECWNDEEEVFAAECFDTQTR